MSARRSRWRLLLGVSVYDGGAREDIIAWMAHLLACGFDIEPFILTLDPPAPCLGWPDLDRAWRTRDASLMRMHARLQAACARADAFINLPGINVHPEMLPALGVPALYACADDPENSEALSRPVAAAYDACLVANAACLDQYRSWGAKQVRFWPLGFHHHRHARTDPSGMTSGVRTVPVAMVCERLSSWRRERLDRFAAAFPQGVFRGAGWPDGPLPVPAYVPLLAHTRIGINIHNSVGPVNTRTFELPANGVMQICDNPAWLPMVFQPGREVVAYTTIEEAIELTRYYLDHEDERIAIAEAGRKRALREYSQEARFDRLLELIDELKPAVRPRTLAPDLQEGVGWAGMVGSARRRFRLACIQARSSAGAIVRGRWGT